MKLFISAMMGLLLGFTFYFLMTKTEKIKPRAYTVTIVNGIPDVNYTATLQVDSLRYYSKESVMVFVDTHVLYVKGDYITFKKN